VTVRVGINGFGRIGRNFLRAVQASDSDVEVVGINDLAANDILAHFLRYDSILGRYPGHVDSDENSLTVDGTKIHASAERDPAALAWGDSTSMPAPRRSSSRPPPPTRTSRS
jgi:glyceraldehyde 3-phosphate dehydrogenase